MKTIKLSLFCSLIFALVMTSCREEEDNNKDLAVQFKVMGSEQVDVKSVIVQVGTEQEIDYAVDGQNWQSESQIINTSSKYVRLASTGKLYDQDSELIVQIWVDGELKVADTATVQPGTPNLIAETSLNFHEL